MTRTWELKVDWLQNAKVTIESKAGDAAVDLSVTIGREGEKGGEKIEIVLSQEEAAELSTALNEAAGESGEQHR